MWVGVRDGVRIVDVERVVVEEIVVRVDESVVVLSGSYSLISILLPTLPIAFRLSSVLLLLICSCLVGVRKECS